MINVCAPEKGIQAEQEQKQQVHIEAGHIEVKNSRTVGHKYKDSKVLISALIITTAKGVGLCRRLSPGKNNWKNLSENNIH